MRRDGGGGCGGDEREEEAAAARVGKREQLWARGNAGDAGGCSRRVVGGWRKKRCGGWGVLWWKLRGRRKRRLRPFEAGLFQVAAMMCRGAPRRRLGLVGVEAAGRGQACK